MTNSVNGDVFVVDGNATINPPDPIIILIDHQVRSDSDVSASTLLILLQNPTPGDTLTLSDDLTGDLVITFDVDVVIGPTPNDTLLNLITFLKNTFGDWEHSVTTNILGYYFQTASTLQAVIFQESSTAENNRIWSSNPSIWRYISFGSDYSIRNAQAEAVLPSVDPVTTNFGPSWHNVPAGTIYQSLIYALNVGSEVSIPNPVTISMNGSLFARKESFHGPTTYWRFNPYTQQWSLETIPYTLIQGLDAQFTNPPFGQISDIITIYGGNGIDNLGASYPGANIDVGYYITIAGNEGTSTILPSIVTIRSGNNYVDNSLGGEIDILGGGSFLNSSATSTGGKLVFRAGDGSNLSPLGLAIGGSVEISSGNSILEASTAYAGKILISGADVDAGTDGQITLDGNTVNIRSTVGGFPFPVLSAGNDGAQGTLGFFGFPRVVQGAAIPDAAGGLNVDTEARAAINSLLASMRSYGLITP